MAHDSEIHGYGGDRWDYWLIKLFNKINGNEEIK